MPKPPESAVGQRVLYCTDTYPPQLNGVSVVTALSIAGLRRRGWEVAVIAPEYPPPVVDAFRSDPQGPPGSITSLPSWPMPAYPDLRLSLPARSTVGRVIDEFQPDIVHCATEFMIGRMGGSAAVKRGLPVVSSYHTDFSRYTEDYGVSWLREPVRQYLKRFHLRSQRVFTPGVAACQELLDQGVSTARVWGRGVDVELFRPDRREHSLRQAYGCNDAFLFLHVGRLAAEKGVERILHAFAAARRWLAPQRDIRLIIAGTGPREKALRAIAGDGVTFLGNLDRTLMLPQLYASADAFVFASHTETLGLVILEAMSSGLPVVAAPVGGVADHLRHEVNGLEYPRGDIHAMAEQMAALATNTELRADLAGGARRTAMDLSWERELDRLDLGYREVCEAHASHLSFDGEIAVA